MPLFPRFLILHQALIVSKITSFGLEYGLPGGVLLSQSLNRGGNPGGLAKSSFCFTFFAPSFPVGLVFEVQMGHPPQVFNGVIPIRTHPTFTASRQSQGRIWLGTGVQP